MSLDDVKEVADQVSSPDPEDAQEQETPVAETAEPSAATGETDDTDLLSVVRDVVGKQSEAEDDQTASPAEGEETVEAESAATDDEDYSKIPFAKHPDFKKLVRKKNEYRDKARAFETQAREYEQDAVRYREVQNFMDHNNLAANEAAELLIVGGLMKTNPVEAWRRAQPTIQKLLVAAGELLPDDLAQRVQRGELNPASAMAESRARAMQMSMQRTQSFQEQRRQQQDAQNAVSANKQAAISWATDREQKDPNFAAKMPSLQREITFLQRTEGVPQDPQGVQEQLARAYKAVNAAFRAPQAAPQAQQRPAQKKPITPVRGGQVAGNAGQSELSTMDIVRQHTRR